MRVNIAGVEVDRISKSETIAQIDQFIKSGKPHYIVTTYSEFIVFAQRDSQFKQVLNSAQLSLPDGVGILWAAKYLSLNTSSAVEALVQIIWTGASLVFNPRYVRDIVPEKISGSKLIWDLAQLAAENNYTLALVGGENRVAETSAQALKKAFPELKVNLAVSDRQFDTLMIDKIAQSNADILCLAYSPPKQEKWIAENLSKLNVKVAIGLGGTFDYLAGNKLYAPDWMIRLGLEWLYRLITQPRRMKRMWNAVPVFILIIYKYKLKKIYDRN